MATGHLRIGEPGSGESTGERRKARDRAGEVRTAAFAKTGHPQRRGGSRFVSTASLDYIVLLELRLF